MQDKEVMPLITKRIGDEFNIDLNYSDYEKGVKKLLRAQRDAGQKVLEAKEKEWREKEADWLEKWLVAIEIFSDTPTYIIDVGIRDHIAQLHQEGKGAIGDV